MRSKSKPLSKMVRAMILYGRHHHMLTIGQCLKMLQGQSITLVLLPFCLLNSLPMPSIPGFSTITGIPIVILGVQLLRGSKALWVPATIARRKLNPGKWIPRLKRLLPTLKRMEKIFRPRWPVFSSSFASRTLGIVFVGMGIVLALPLPFMNFPVGFALSLLSIGMITRDGALILFALLCNFLVAGGMTFVVGGLAGAAQS